MFSLNKIACKGLTLRLWQNCCHFADDIFRLIFLNKNGFIYKLLFISFQFSQKVIAKGLINNIVVVDNGLVLIRQQDIM